ncbi:cytochrome P450 [Pholiota conissans]|uniref:Cytochrome P450 n=1 Tax=Pholiota conissans TaxID=109636 RepID=A0A9P6D2Z0_9AGAR|nr:cytochrome P450 [Pholiota conissans]
MDMDSLLFGATFATALVFGLLLYLFSSKSYANLPPGPPRKLFSTLGSQGVGSTKPLWQRFDDLHHLYGPVVSTFQGKTVVIVLGTIKAATDLLEKRGRIYSSRPRNIMAGEILSGGMRGLGMPYGSRWRNWRSLMHAGMSIEASQNYKALQSIESKILLHDLINEPLQMAYRSHFTRFAASIAFCIGYGRRIRSLDDPLVVANSKVDECATQGKYIVESWPILLKLPRFMQWFRWDPEAQRKTETALFTSLMDDVRDQIKRGVAKPSIAKRGLEKQADFGLSDLETAYACSAPFTAGVTTTISVIDVFFLAMLHHPGIMRKAQVELDSVVGSSRMPDFEDAGSLPYIQAIIKESMRWRPIAPLAVPHNLIADDTYNSMYLPKDSTVVANLYSMSLDPEEFHRPDQFIPERYLEEGPHSNFYFGFGRRICPGMHIAQNSLLIILSRILWAFTISPVKDKNGRDVLPPVDSFEGGLVARPAPFVYGLTPRNEDIRALILEEWAKADEEGSSWL